MIICGSVSAANTTLGGELDSEIALNITLEHPEALSGNNLPNVVIKDYDGNSISNVSITKSGNSQYKLNFKSNKTLLKVNVTALGHLSQLVNVSMIFSNSTNLSYGFSNVSLRAYNIMILGGGPDLAKPFIEANQNLREKGYYFNLNFFSYNDITSNSSEIKNKIKTKALSSDVIIMYMMSDPDAIATKQLLSGTNATIYAVSITAFSNDTTIISNDTELGKYFSGGPENLAKLQLKALQKTGMFVNSSENLTAITYSTQFIYHPQSVNTFNTWADYFTWYNQTGHYNSNAPWVGIMFDRSFFLNGNTELYQETLKSFEQKGVNVIMAVTSGDAGRINAISNYFMNGNLTRVNAVVACLSFYIVYGKPEQSATLLEKLNVPVFTPIYALDLANWKNSSAGLAGQALYAYIAMPELEGRIEPIMMGGVDSAVDIDPYTGISVTPYVALTDRIERITRRVTSWISLQMLANNDKKIALLYYNIDGGKDSVSATYLNVPESISAILTALKNSGYDIPSNYSVESIIDVFLTVGNNVGSWAPGELEKVVKAGAINIPLSTYMAWFNQLPLSLQQEVIAEWGPAPGNVMVYNNSIVIPGIMLGNIFLGPQPMRGWSEDPSKITHSPTLPPSHQYIAFYLWLQNQFNANAVIHLGTHGSLEWLPGRSVGLGEDDWPDVLIGNIPNIYPYIVDNPGEGTQAKRRGYAVIIDYLTAPLISSGLYGDLSDLKDLMNSYDGAGTDDRKELLKTQIKSLITKLHFDEELGLNLDTDPFDDVKNKVEHKLDEIAATLMPYGLHTFGVTMNDTLIDQMVESIVSFDPLNRNNTAFRTQIRQELSQNFEMENLLAALRGEFISPGLSGDPIRKAGDVLPTGANFYSFDPRTAPDKTAWEIGKKMADDLITDYYMQNGRFPETVGIVLWAMETMRTSGHSIAMILRLMGVEPVLDSGGRFTNIKVTPLENLTINIGGVTVQRPRIDVLVTMSGLFRDTFSYSIDLMDKAFRMVANLSESTNSNFVKKHYLADYNKYVSNGMSNKDANLYAGARIFGPPAESYGNGVSELIETTSAWNNQSDIIETYLARQSYIYGSGVYGINGLESFKNQLKQVDATVKVIDNIYGVLNTDDVFADLGGLTMTAKSLSGKDISVYIANTRIDPKIETLGDFLSTELRSQMLNPKWAEGMLNEGFSGARQVSKQFGYLFGWAAVQPDAVKDWMWKGITDMYILDSNYRNQMIKGNPYSFASAASWALEAARRGMWKADSATLTALANEYIKTIVDYGVVCCHHTCANLEFNKWVAKVSSASSTTLKAYAAIMQSATGKDIGLVSNDPSTPSQGGSSTWENGQSSSTENKGQSSSSNSQSSSSSQSKESSDSSASESTTGSSNSQQKAYEVTKNSQGSSDSTGVSFFAILGIIGLLGLFGVGYYRKNI